MATASSAQADALRDFPPDQLLAFLGALRFISIRQQELTVAT